MTNGREKKKEENLKSDDCQISDAGVGVGKDDVRKMKISDE